MRLFVAASMIAVLFWLLELLVRHWPVTLGGALLIAGAACWDLRRGSR